MSKRRGASVLGTFVDIVTGIVIAVLLVCVAARFVFGVRAFTVLTASMVPTLEVGDLIIDVPASYDDIEEGDVITYVLNADLDVVTHRVIEKNRDDQTLITKGDANKSVDGTPVDYQNVVGVVRMSFPRLGHALRFLSTTSGKVAAGVVIASLFAAIVIIRVIVGMSDDRDASSETVVESSSGANTQVIADDSAKNVTDERALADSGRVGEQRRSAIAASIAAELDDDDGDLVGADMDFDDDDEWINDFDDDDGNFDDNDEYDSKGAADRARPSQGSGRLASHGQRNEDEGETHHDSQ